MPGLAAIDAGIRQLHARYIDAVWRKDGGDVAGCFTIDGEWTIAGLHLRGHDEIAAAFDHLIAGAARVRLILGQALLERRPGGAIGRVPVTELVKLADSGAAMTLGVYHDRYVGKDDDWRFAHRHFALDYRGPPDLTGPLIPCPDHGRFPEGPAPDAPTFTRQSG